MLVKPTVTELLKRAKNRYELVIATSKRARQIASGSEPLIKECEKSPVTEAAEEINAGKITIIRDENAAKEDNENGSTEFFSNDEITTEEEAK